MTPHESLENIRIVGGPPVKIYVDSLEEDVRILGIIKSHLIHDKTFGSGANGNGYTVYGALELTEEEYAAISGWYKKNTGFIR